MRWIDYIKKDVRTLADILELAQSDGLQAKGCSLDLIYPDVSTGSWEDWLCKDIPNADSADFEAELDHMRRRIDEAAMKEKED